MTDKAPGPNGAKSPIFLFSPIRSGSTMSQRILAAHEEVETTSEPWILLPHLYALRGKGIYAEYNHSVLAVAMREFCGELPNGVDDYLAEMRDLALRLYAKASRSDARYFLDKTPRYYLILDDIFEAFPEDKYIFLWRNPLAVVASVMETWGRGNWNLYRFKVDLYDGLENLVRAYQKHREKSLAVRYEDLLVSPEEKWATVFDYLELSFDPSILRRFGDVTLHGSMGDPTGIKLYSQVSQEPLEKWKQTLANPIRKSWCRRYLRWIGRERLRVMGYDMDELLDELDRIPTSSRRVGSDIIRNGYGVAFQLLETKILGDQLRSIADWEHIHAHQ